MIQTELDAESLAVPVRILGINPAGHESGNTATCDGRDLPWLQETAQDDVLASWQARSRNSSPSE